VGEDTSNPLYVMKCQEYFYKKEYDLVTKKHIFELYFVYPLAISDLYEVLQNNRKKGINFSEDQVIIFLYQILMGLKKMKAEHGIKHRDLKPQNILLLD
jgi:serine/threonine protein kinase